MALLAGNIKRRGAAAISLGLLDVGATTKQGSDVDGAAVVRDVDGAAVPRDVDQRRVVLGISSVYRQAYCINSINRCTLV